MSGGSSLASRISPHWALKIFPNELKFDMKNEAKSNAKKWVKSLEVGSSIIHWDGKM